METYNFKVKENLVLENSYGIIDSADDVELNVTIGINSDDYGWFEIYDEESGGEAWYAEGGLWFENKSLVDYDGVFELIPPITNKLKDLGYTVDL